MQLDPEATGPVQSLLSNWLARHGKLEDAHQRELAAFERGEVEEKAAAERAKLPSPKKLKTHTLPESDLAALRAVLVRHREIGHADLAAGPADTAAHTRAFLRAHYPTGLIGDA